MLITSEYPFTYRQEDGAGKRLVSLGNPPIGSFCVAASYLADLLAAKNIGYASLIEEYIYFDEEESKIGIKKVPKLKIGISECIGKTLAVEAWNSRTQFLNLSYLEISQNSQKKTTMSEFLNKEEDKVNTFQVEIVRDIVFVLKCIRENLKFQSAFSELVEALESFYIRKKDSTGIAIEVISTSVIKNARTCSSLILDYKKGLKPDNKAINPDLNTQIKELLSKTKPFLADRGCFPELFEREDKMSSEKGIKTLEEFFNSYSDNSNSGKEISNYECFLTERNKRHLKGCKVLPNKEAEIICSSVRTCNFRNFYLSGLPGTGKTTTAMLVAAGLNVPYTVFSCHAYTEPSDLLGGIVPNFNNANLLSLKEYMDDPMTSYFDLTDKSLPHNLELYNQLELINDAYEDAYRKGLTALGNDSSKLNYMMVLSSLLELCDVPGVVEIQEISDIPDSSVAVALNSFLAEGQITLMGNTFERHPENIVIFTTNDVNPVAPSVLDRSAMEFLFHQIDKDEMLSRISNQSNLPQETLKDMVRIIVNIGDYMSENRIKFGTCGFRSLQDWAALVEKNHMNPYYAGLLAVTNKVSMKKEQRHYCETMLEEVFDNKDEALYTEVN